MQNASDFEQIVLTRKELSTLKRLRSHSSVPLPAEQSAALHEYHLILSDHDGVDAFNAPIPVNRWSLSDDGRRYLRWLSLQRRRVRREHSHDWLIAVFSALAGALLSQPLWSLLNALFPFIHP